MKPLIISNAQARDLLLEAQGLNSSERKKLDSAGLLKLIEKLGFVQVDSIHNIERAHHHILFSRNHTYRPQMLAKLLEQERTLFEHWTHDAAIVPVNFYRYWKPRFAVNGKKFKSGRWWRKLMKKGESALGDVRARLASGPVRSRDFEKPEKKGEAWWGWAPHKAALEYLWFTGETAIAARDNFHKVYDLSVRVIAPEHHGAEAASHAEMIDWACAGALDRLIFGTLTDITRFWDSATIAEAKAWAVCHKDDLVEVLIEPADGGKPKPFLARADIVERAKNAPEPAGRLRLLSPFDPLVRDRSRLTRVFGFDYRIEIYVPAKKRKYGYYVLPMLEGRRFTGRLDAKAARDKDALDVINLWFEPGVKKSKARIAALEGELARLARFAGVKRVSFSAKAARKLRP